MCPRSEESVSEESEKEPIVLLQEEPQFIIHHVHFMFTAVENVVCFLH